MQEHGLDIGPAIITADRGAYRDHCSDPFLTPLLQPVCSSEVPHSKGAHLLHDGQVLWCGDVLFLACSIPKSLRKPQTSSPSKFQVDSFHHVSRTDPDLPPSLPMHALCKPCVRIPTW